MIPKQRSDIVKAVPKGMTAQPKILKDELEYNSVVLYPFPEPYVKVSLHTALHS